MEVGALSQERVMPQQLPLLVEGLSPESLGSLGPRRLRACTPSVL